MSLTSQIRYCRALDSTATDGSGKTGLVFGDFTAKYLTQGGTLTSLTTETITTLGTYQAPTSAAHVRIKELSSSAPCQGIYEVHFHNTQTAVAGTKLWLFLSATGAAIQPVELDLVTTAALPAAAAGAAGGLMISGTNVGPWSVSGGVTFSNSAGSALTCSSSGSNGHGLNLSGNGSGDGLEATGGIIGRGAHLIGGTTSGQGLYVEGVGSVGAEGAAFVGIGSGAAVSLMAGATGKGLSIFTTAGDGISVTPNSGHALVLTGNGTSKHGMLITGGTAGTSDGLKAVAGTGGVPIRGDVTGNLTGTVGGIAGTTQTLDVLQTSLSSTHGSGSWVTATGFAVAGDAMTLADGAITDAKITFPAESAGRPTTFLAAMRRLWEWACNKRTRDRSTGTVLLRNAADGATLETQTQSTASTTVDTQTKGV